MKIGITGGICMGKSYVINYIKSLGYSIYCVDDITKKLLKYDKINYNIVVKTFGNAILLPNKEINTKKLTNLIFSNEEKRKLLMDLTCFNIIKEIKTIIKKNNIVFLEIPLLFELNLKKLVDIVLLIYCSEEIQIKRLIKRDNLSKKEALKRIKNNITINKQLSLSDYYINTNQNKKEIKNQINLFLKKINL